MRNAASIQFAQILWARGEEPNLANMPEWDEAYGCTIHQASGLRAWAGSHIERRTSSLRSPTSKRFAPHPGSSSRSGFSCPKDWGNRLDLASARGLGFQISEGASSASFDGAFFASPAVILKVASGHRHYCQWRSREDHGVASEPTTPKDHSGGSSDDWPSWTGVSIALSFLYGRPDSVIPRRE